MLLGHREGCGRPTNGRPLVFLSVGPLWGQMARFRQDDVTAHMWFDLAASRSTDELLDRAGWARVRVAEELSASQRAEAQRLARAWDAAHQR